MRILVHLAEFGPLKGHAFLRGTDSSLGPDFRDAAWRTDLPQTAPAGVEWAPFLRLVHHKDWLVLIYTRPAANVVRGGMVFSRAAFVPLAHVEEINDLTSLANVLRSWPPDEAPLQPIHYDSDNLQVQAEPPSELAAQVASALGRSQQRPIVVARQDGFDDAMLELWRRVPPEFRKGLTFGMSFGPGDVHELAVVCTPEILSTRWPTSAVVDTTSRDEACAHTATLLNLPLDASVRAFANSAELRLDSSKSLAIALQAADLWNTGRKPAEHIALLRILSAMSGSGANAKASKSAVVDRLVATSEVWTEQDILLMRNIDLASLPGSTKISQALFQWVSKQRPTGVSQGLSEILTSWATEKATPAWLSVVGKAFESSFAAKDVCEALFDATWLVVSKLPESISRTLSLVASNAAMENHLLSSMDRLIAANLADALLPEFTSRGWWTLAGTLLARSRSADEALSKALAIAPSTAAGRLKTVSSALSEASDAQITLLAVKSSDPAAIQVAADASIRTPAAMLAFNWAEPAWFQLLDFAQSKSPEIVDALPNPTTGLGQTIALGITDDVVWRTVAKCSLADLTEVPGRSVAWSLIPSAHLETVKSKTAGSWLVRFELGSDSANLLEEELAAAVRVQVHVRGYLVAALRRNPSALPRYLSAFPFTADKEVVQFLEDIQHNDLRLSEIAAKTIGAMARDNHWHETARLAKSAFNQRLDFHPILNECFRLLSVIDQMWLAWKLSIPFHLSPEDAWQAFESEAATMYSNGPMDRELWSRSGGRNEDLVLESNGRASWHRCARDLRSGMHPGVESVLNVMLEDYSQSDTLRQLLQQRFWR